MPLRAAIAIEEITPGTATELSGFASRQGLATGVLQPLTARVLVLDDGAMTFALLALDLIGPPDELPGLLAGELPPGLALVAAGTHTHGGPPVLSRAMLGRCDRGYLQRVADRSAQAIRSAMANLKPVHIAHRKVPAPGIAFNRRDPAGPVDHAADVVTLHDADGGISGLWLNFACHPVVLGPENFRYSPDFPGFARERLEAEFGAPVVYTTGCAGQINLGHSPLDSIRKIGMEKRTPAEAERIGLRLADAVSVSLRAETPSPVADGAVRYAERVWPAAFEKVSAEARAALADQARCTLADPEKSAGEKAMAGIDLAWLEKKYAGLDLKVAAARLGPLACAFLPGEVFIETSLAIQAAAPGAIVVGYAHSNPGYIPHRTAIGGYEVDIAWRPYGAPGPFAPGAADDLERNALELLRGL